MHIYLMRFYKSILKLDILVQRVNEFMINWLWDIHLKRTNVMRTINIVEFRFLELSISKPKQRK